MNDLATHWGSVIAADKQKLKGDGVRRGYYAASDGIGNLGSALRRDAVTKKDSALLKEFTALDTALGAILKKLNSKYFWD